MEKVEEAWEMLCYALDNCDDGDPETCKDCPVEKAGGSEDCVQYIWDAILRTRPACTNVHDGREFQCSACGMQWHLLDREDGFEEWAHVRNPKFCPSCGAEVTR